MSDFPRMIYRAGTECELHGAMVDTMIVGDQGALDAALADRWVLTPSEAAPALSYPESIYQPPDDAPPTRAELEMKARELGISFDGRTKDAKLAARIEAALAAARD